MPARIQRHHSEDRGLLAVGYASPVNIPALRPLGLGTDQAAALGQVRQSPGGDEFAVEHPAKLRRAMGKLDL
jgi:hypothetical protein